MKPPRPRALRLTTRAQGAKPPAPPFGLRTWSPDAQATAVLLDATGVDLAEVGAVAQQIPGADALPGGTPVLVLGAAARPGSFWRRILGGRRIPVARATRCTALIARGYVDVGAGDADGVDVAWGWVPGFDRAEREPRPSSTPPGI
jgi:hypothetical protein